jgi:hypothetical protein
MALLTASALHRARLLPRALAVFSVIGAAACKSPEREPAPSAAPAAEPMNFSFALPSHYTTVELSGEGSETLRAPPGARVTRGERGARVEAGPDFAIEIAHHPKPLAEMKAAIEPARRRLEENDLVVFAVPTGNAPTGNVAGGLAFVSVRELVPEWDENDRRQFACSSVGATAAPAPNSAEVRAFSKAAVQEMVAACRTLELPRLE